MDFRLINIIPDKEKLEQASIEVVPSSLEAISSISLLQKESEIDKIKIVKTNRYIEMYEYMFSPNRNQIKNKIKNFSVNPEVLQSSNKRAVSTVEEIIRGNFINWSSKHMVLTFRNENKFDITSFNECDKRRVKFVTKLKKYLNGSYLKYICVPELQERGVVHYHFVIDMKFVEQKKLEELWKWGIVFIKRNRSATYLSKDLAKYVSKTIRNVRTKGCRRYYCSNNVVRPQLFIKDDAKRLVQTFRGNIEKVVSITRFPSTWLGEIKKTCFYLKRNVKPRVLGRYTNNDYYAYY